MHTNTRRGAVSSTLKIALAAVFAFAGIAWAVWTVLPERGPAEPRQILRGPIDDEGNPVETDFTRVRSDSAVADAMTTLAERVRDIAPTLPTLSDVGAAQAEPLAAAARLSLEPFIAGSYQQFLDAIASLGGVVPEGDQQSGLYTRLAELADNGSVDLSRLEVLAVDPEAERRQGPGAAQPRIVRREVDADDAPAPGAPRTRQNVNRNVMAMRPQSMFPNAPTSPAETTMIDVKVPVKPRGAKPGEESILGVRLAWVDPPGVWQPAEYRVEEVTVTETELPPEDEG